MGALSALKEIIQMDSILKGVSVIIALLVVVWLIFYFVGG